MQKVVIHLDMNSYFASVEQQDFPEYRGKPLGVCEHLGGIIIAASVEAKRWGIKTGTPVWEAKKLYPKIILSHTHADRYRHYNRLMVGVVGDYTDYVEKYSIDEVFLDVSKVCNTSSLAVSSQLSAVSPFIEAIKVAHEIKERMKKEVGDYLRCGIGIAENKLLAKIGSDLQKPDGLVVIGNDELRMQNAECNCTNSSFCIHNSAFLFLTKQDLYNRLQLTDIPGIGKRQEKRLNDLGIRSLKDLRDYSYSRLVAKFGIMGHHLHAMGQLQSTWKPKVEQEDKIKSIGHMYTLPQEYRDPKFFVPVLYKLCEMVGRRLRRQELMGNVISFYIRDKNYESVGKDEKLGFYIYDGRDIFLQCMKIFENSMGKKIPEDFKLIGVTVGGLIPFSDQLPLFQKDENRRRVSFALDKINDKYGDFTVSRVPVLAAGKVFRDSIGFGRLREKHIDKGA
jgi:DNA polymerase-4